MTTQHRNLRLCFSSILLAAAGVACGGEDVASDATAPRLDNPGRVAMTGRAALSSCSRCPEWTPDPALSYQTPTALHTGVMRIELMRAADDPAPAVLWQGSEPLDADLMAGATFADISVLDIPQATYSHARVTLAYVDLTIPATGHSPGHVAPGELLVSYALSDYASAALGARQPGDYLATFAVMGYRFDQSGNQPVTFPPSYPGATAAVVGGEYQVIFELPDGPVTVDHGRAESVDIQVTYYVDQAFGWQELLLPSYQVGQFDIADTPADCEIPASLGVRGFEADVIRH